MKGAVELSRPERRRRTAVLVTLLALLFWQLPALAGTDPWAPFETPWFDSISTTSGLPHSVTTSVVQDKRGLIWVGTMGGLVRYDGQQTQVFDARKGVPQGLPDAYVRCLMALPDGGLLIGTNAGGVVQFNPHNNRFKAWPVGPGGSSSGKIYAMASDHQGGVWIATDNGLDHLDLNSGKMHPVDGQGLTAGRNFSVFQDREGSLWLGNNQGLVVRRYTSKRFDPVRLADPAINAVVRSALWAIHEDSAGRLWLGSVDKGAVYRDEQGHWQGVPGYFSHEAGSQWPTVRAIMNGADDSVWLATDGYGVIHYHAGASHSRRIRHDPAVPSSLPGDTVRALLQDRTGNIWLATNLGLAVMNPAKRVAFALLPSPSHVNALSSSNVHDVFVDSRDRIWLGLDSGRIDVIDLAAGTTRHLRLQGRQSHRDVLAFAEMPDGAIWIGSEGVARIDPDSMRITVSLLPRLDDKPVLSMARDRTRVLIGTYEGLFRYDLQAHTLEQIQHDPNDPGSLVNDTVRHISRVNGKWWYSTARGISIAGSSRASHGFRNLVHGTGKPASLPQDYAGGITQDKSGRTWISTFGGLAEANPAESPGKLRQFRIFTTDDGLSSNKVNTTISDHNGMIWVSLSNGISMLNPDTGAVQTLGQRDGLAVNSYVNIAAAKTRNGELLFGGLGGLTIIRPDLAKPATEDMLLAVTHAVVQGKELAYGNLPIKGDTIAIGAHARNMRLDFGLLDYRDNRQTRYSYRMDGLDTAWTTLTPGGIASAVYTNLPHGDYTLILRAQTHGMYPRRIESRLHVTVEPLWYESLAARLAGIALLLALIVGLVYLRTWVLHKRARELQAQIDDSTRELREANARLDRLAGTDGLTGVYNRRRFLELVSARLRRAPDQDACMALLDLDHFKNVNDTYGHMAGDQVLRITTAIIRKHTRSSDLIGRFGGEELMICMPGTRIEDARKIAERIREALAETLIHHQQQEIQTTISIGLAARKPNESIEQWLTHTDSALYRAKRNGRNCTIIDG